MFNSYKLRKIEAYFDGALDNPAEAEALLASDAACAQHFASLEQMRTAAKTVPQAEINDFQLNNFLSGIREQIAEEPVAVNRFNRERGRSIWAMASLAAAAVLVALSTFYIFAGGTPATPVRATEVESVSTGIDGATTTVEYGPDGTATIWINLTGDDL